MITGEDRCPASLGEEGSLWGKGAQGQVLLSQASPVLSPGEGAAVGMKERG